MPLYIFENIRKVIEAENICKEQGIGYTVKTIPKTISSECGMALCVDLKSFSEILASKNIAFTIVTN